MHKDKTTIDSDLRAATAGCRQKAMQDFPPRPRKITKALIARAKRESRPLYHVGSQHKKGLVHDKLARRVMRKALAEGRGFKKKIRDAHREIADLRGLASEPARPTPHQQRRLVESFMAERRAAREAR